MNNETETPKGRISRLERIVLQLIRIPLGHSSGMQNEELQKLEDEMTEVIKTHHSS